MTGVQIALEDTGKPELLEWVREHGIDPNRVTMQDGCLPEIWNGLLCYGYIPLNEDGRDLIDEFHNRVVVVPRWVKVKRPLPAGVGRVIDECQQLTAHECPTCEAAGVTFAPAAAVNAG